MQLTLFNKSDPISGASGIPRNMTTIAQKLKSAGYHTMQAGKVCAAHAVARRAAVAAARRRRSCRHAADVAAAVVATLASPPCRCAVALRARNV